MVTAGRLNTPRELDGTTWWTVPPHAPGHGSPSGELCAYRAAGLMQEYGKADGRQACVMLRQFLEER